MTIATPLKKIAAVAMVSLLGTGVLAQDLEDRIINIQGAPRGDLRNGPVTFNGNPVTATVSSLKITSDLARLAAPKGQTILESKGQRSARFIGDVRVQRGRLSAQGGELLYSEATGTGVLTENARAAFVPENKSDDTVYIKAGSMSLDVDDNVSTSQGNVVLLNGKQSAAAAQLVFDEDRELGVLTGSPRLRQQATAGRKELLVTGQEVRALTDQNVVYVKGNVKLVQGSIITTGDALFYNDTKNVAYVVGDAVSRDTSSGSVIKAPSGGALEQRTDLARVRVLSSGYNIPTEQFKLRSE